MSPNPYTQLAHLLAARAAAEWRADNEHAPGATPGGQRAVPTTPAAGTGANVSTSENRTGNPPPGPRQRATFTNRHQDRRA